jgi:hypothetical protein
MYHKEFNKVNSRLLRKLPLSVYFITLDVYKNLSSVFRSILVRNEHITKVCVKNDERHVNNISYVCQMPNLKHLIVLNSRLKKLPENKTLERVSLRQIISCGKEFTLSKFPNLKHIVLLTNNKCSTKIKIDLKYFPNLISLKTNIKVINSTGVLCPNLKSLELYHESTKLKNEHYPNLNIFKANITKSTLKKKKYPFASNINILQVGRDEVEGELINIFIPPITNIIYNYYKTGF